MMQCACRRSFASLSFTHGKLFVYSPAGLDVHEDVCFVLVLKCGRLSLISAVLAENFEDIYRLKSVPSPDVRRC